MKDKIILIDLDDVLIDTLPLWVEELNKRHSTNVKVEDITDWDIGMFFPNLSKEEVYSPLLDISFWDNVKPKKDAVYYTKLLKEEGFKLYVCTASASPICGYKIEKTVLKHFPHFSWEDIIITRNKSLINGDILIDDCFVNLICGKYQGVLVNAHHNQSFNSEDFDIPRVYTWKEIYEHIHKTL